jgi:hypothetical protein
MNYWCEECLVDANKMDKPGIAFTVACVGLTLYWMFTYSGPYRYLAELQMKLFDWYVPKLTVTVIVVAFIGLAIGVKAVFHGAERPAPGLPEGSGTASSGIGVALQPVSTGNNAGFTSPYIRMWFLLVPLGLGAYLYFNASQAGELRQLRVQDFDSGQVKSRVVYADVRGQLSRKYMTKDHYMYIPMVESNSSEPAHVLVGVDKAKTKQYLQHQSDATFVVRGMVQRDLEDDVRVAFEKSGIPLADKCWVVHTGPDPKSDRQMGLILMAISAVLAAALGSWLSYKSRQAAAGQPVKVGA